MAIKMKKFLSSMATLLLLVQVVLPGAVAAQEAEAAGVDTSVSVSTAPSVESSNADNAADSQPSNEGAQSEGQDSVSLSEATKSIEVTEVSETLPSVADAVKNLTDSLTTNLKKATEAIAEGVSAAVDAVKDVLGIETTESEDLPSGAMRAMVVLPPEVNTFTYIFKDGDVELHKQILKNGEKLAQPATPEKQECKIFEGWFIGEEKVVFGQEVTVNATQEIIVNAKYREACSVTFSYQGKVHATKEVKKGEKTNADGVNYTITDGNLSFSHWSQTENGEAFDFGTQIEKDLTLFLLTKAAYKVVFDSQEGSYLFPVYVDQGGTLTAPTEPTRLGYSFKYWSTQKNGSAFDFSQGINENLTLYAVWEARTDTPYKVIYWQENANDDSYSFKEMVEKTGTTDTQAKYDKKSYKGFTFDAAEDVTIKADGTSVVNVKYKRKTFNFIINREAFYVRDSVSQDWREVPKNIYDTYIILWHKKIERVKYSETPFKYQQSTASAYDKAVNDYPNYSWYLEKEGTIAYSEAPAMLNRDLTIYGRYAGKYKYTIHYKEKSTNAKIKEDYSFFGKQ